MESSFTHCSVVDVAALWGRRWPTSIAVLGRDPAREEAFLNRLFAEGSVNRAATLRPMGTIPQNIIAVIALAGPSDGMSKALSGLIEELNEIRARICTPDGLPVLIVSEVEEGDEMRGISLVRDVSDTINQGLAAHNDGGKFGSIDCKPVIIRSSDAVADSISEAVIGHREFITLLRARTDSYQRRCRVQGMRLLGVLGLLIVGIVVAINIGIYWHSPQVRSTYDRVLPFGDRAEQSPDWAARGEELVFDLTKLIRFDGFVKDDSVQWQLWSRAVEESKKSFSALTNSLENDKYQRLLSRLNSLDEKVEAIHHWAVLLGPCEPNQEDEFSLLLPANPSLEALQDRMRRHDGLELPAHELPDEVPFKVVIAFQSFVSLNRYRGWQVGRAHVLEKLCELEPDGSVQAGKDLLRGWLSGSTARDEFAPWFMYFQILASVESMLGIGRDSIADNSGNPLLEMQGFLQLPHIILPLTGVELSLLPELRVSGDLEIHHVPAGRVSETNVTKISLAGTRPNIREYFGSSPKSIPFQPGDKVWARIPIKDSDGKEHLLTWSAEESPSTIYSYATLLEPPRIHDASQTDPLSGEIAFGVRLKFSGWERFRLPKLYPRQ